MAFLGLSGANHPAHRHRKPAIFFGTGLRREPPEPAVTANPEPATAQETALSLTAANQSLAGENAP